MNKQTWEGIKKLHKNNTENNISTKVEVITMCSSVVKGKIKTITGSKLVVQAGKTLVEYPASQIVEIKVG